MRPEPARCAPAHVMEVAEPDIRLIMPRMSAEEFQRGILTRQKEHARLDRPTSVEERVATPEEVLASYSLPGGERDRIAEKNPSFEGEPVIRASLEKMKRLETAAWDQERWGRITPEVAKTVQRIIVFAAPGTYTQGHKEDRYKDKSWSWGMDRARSDRAARLGIFLAGKRTGQDFSSADSYELLNANNSQDGLSAQREEAKQAVRDSGIRFTYLGTAEEAGATELALKNPRTFIPAENVDIMSDGIVNTLTQANAIKDYLEKAQLKEGDGIVFVAEGPQLVRMEGMLKKSGGIPPGIEVWFEPLPTPDKEYTLMESRGDAYYRGVGDSEGELAYDILGENRNP